MAKLLIIQLLSYKTCMLSNGGLKLSAEFPKWGSDNSKKDGVMLKGGKKFSWSMLVLYMSQLLVRAVLKNKSYYS